MVSGTDRFLTLLGDGAEPLEAALALIAEDHGTLLRRASLPRRLDAQVLEALGDPGDLTTILELGLADAVLGHRGVYRLHDEVRRRLLATARRAADAATATTELSRRLVRHYEERDDGLEALYHLFAIDRVEAIARFTALFAAADERFDLTTCRDLLDVVADRLAVLDGGQPDEHESLLWSEHEAYLNARGAWLDDWYRSARFFEPGNSRAAIERLLAGDCSTLHMWAQGGRGKTMHLRWLVARRCIPKPDRIACARVDFDAIEVSAALDRPWLVLLELAAQLDPQLRDRPFLDLVKDYSEHRARLWPTVDGDQHANPRRTPDTTDVRRRFASALEALEAHERVVVIFDTLEVPLLAGERAGGQHRLEALFADLAWIRRRVPSLRVILSGRYDLRERLPGFGACFPHAACLHLTGFTDTEAGRYLREVRQLRDTGLVAAATHAGDGVPFKLALLADVIEQDPDLTPEDIRRYRDHDLLYLIKRVLERIEPEVRWLLRYGVVARTLDRAFVRDVMAPFLRAGAVDDPAEDGLPDGLEYPEHLWDVTPSTDVAAVDGLWGQLARYAGQASWVELERGPLEALRFHPEVVNPMRRLLAGNPVFASLQRSACAYFEDRALHVREDADHWLREAVFHHFQLAGDAGSVFWRGKLAALASPESAERRRGLAAELLGSDYVEDGVPREWHDGTPLISAETLIEARFELGWASAQIARMRCLPRSATQWSEAHQCLEEVAAAGERGPLPIADARMHLAHALLRLAEGQVKEAQELIALAHGGGAPLEDVLWLKMEHADETAARQPRVAPDHYRAALRMADEAPTALRWQRPLRTRLARAELARDRCASAFVHASAVATEEPSAEHAQLLATIHLRAGAAAEAASVAATGSYGNGHKTTELVLTEARARIELLDPAAALKLLRRLTPIADRGADAARLTAESLWSAEIAELLGAASAELLDIAGARRELSRAVELYRIAGDEQALGRTFLRRAALQLRTRGDLREAALEISHAQRIGLTHGTPTWISLEALRAEHDVRSGRTLSALAIVSDGLDVLDRIDAPPSAFVELALAGIACGDLATQEQLLGVLCDQLEQVDSQSGRLALLHGLTRCPVLRQASAARCAQLHALVSAQVDPGPWHGSNPALGFVSAEVDRVLGDTDDARRRLSGLVDATLRSGEVAVLRWLDAHSRLGEGAHASMPEAMRTNVRWPGSTPLMQAALRILAARNYLTAGSLSTRTPYKLLREAEDLLDRKVEEPGGWQGLLHEQLAEVNRRRRLIRERRRHASRAAEIYERLGDTTACARAAGVLAASRGALTAADDLTVNVDIAHNHVFVHWRAPGDPGIEVRPPAPRNLLRAIADDVPGAPDVLRRTLFASGPFALDPATPFTAPDMDVRLITTAASQQIPWELALAGGPHLPRSGAAGHLYRATPAAGLDVEDVMALQRALQIAGADLQVDGVLGRRTRAAIDRFRRAADLEPIGSIDPLTEQLLLSRLAVRSVTALQSEAGLSLRDSRSLRQSAVSVEHVYASRGFHVETLRSSTFDAVEAGLRAHESAVVHICAGFNDDANVTALDLGGDRVAWEPRSPAARGPAHQLTATALDQALRGTMPKPIVVLDPPMPRSRIECVKQLALRNDFASDLFALGNVRAILAVGLASYGDQERMRHLVAAGLASATRLGAVIDAVRARDHGDDAHTLLSFGAAALFARTADLRPPWTP